MSSNYAFALLDAMLDNAGEPMLMSNGKPRYIEELCSISPCLDTAQALCRTLGLSEDLTILRNSQHNAIQIPAEILAAATFVYKAATDTSDACAVINGEEYGEMFDEGLIDNFADLAKQAKRPTARLFLRQD